MSDGAESIENLIRQVNAGDTEAFDKLLTKYRPYLRVIAQRAMRQMFQKKFDASDAVQQTCLEAFNGMESFRGEGEPAFNAWITRILQRNVANLMRDHTAQKRDVRRELHLATDEEAMLTWQLAQEAESGPVSRVVRGEAALALAKALTEMPNSQRTAVQMRFLEGCKLTEIADYMEITKPSVARLVDRGLESLRKSLPTELK